MMPASHMAFAAGVGGFLGLPLPSWAAFVAGSYFPDLLDRSLVIS